MVDRCIELLGNHYRGNTIKHSLAQVRVPCTAKRRHRADENVQEVLKLRERGWEGLPPPPVFTADKPGPNGTGKEDPSATPVAAYLGLPNIDPENQCSHAPPPESVTVPETEAIPSSPVIQSPPISIATMPDFEVADILDDESPTDPTTVTLHDTLNFEDGNVEVLCGNTLFRVHASILSLHSPGLRQMFAQATLATAKSPNGCPRILSSDKATDFATLLKTVYLPGYVGSSLLDVLFRLPYCYRFPERDKVPDFDTFSSLLRITTKYEMPAVRPQLLKVARDAYPETFEGVTPTKSLGESVFSGPTPHPNEVLNLFVRQNLTSATWRFEEALIH